MFNPFLVTNVILISMLMFMPYPWVGIVLSLVMFILSLFYYYTIYTLLIGIRETAIQDNLESLMDSTLSTSVNIVALVALYKLTPYGYVSFWCAPWVTLASLTLAIAWLIYFEYIEIKYTDDE